MADKFIKNKANLSPLINISPSERIKIIVTKNNIALFFLVLSKIINNPNKIGKILQDNCLISILNQKSYSLYTDHAKANPNKFWPLKN